MCLFGFSFNVRLNLKYVVKLICASVNGNRKKEDIIAQLQIDVVVPFNRLRWFYDFMLYVLYLSGHKSIFCIHKKIKDFKRASKLH